VAIVGMRKSVPARLSSRSYAVANLRHFAVLSRIATDRQVPVLAPERLEQAGGGPEPHIKRLVDAMFLEDVGRDEGQVVNGFSEFRGHASRSKGQANSGDGGRNLPRASSYYGAGVPRSRFREMMNAIYEQADTPQRLVRSRFVDRRKAFRGSSRLGAQGLGWQRQDTQSALPLWLLSFHQSPKLVGRGLFRAGFTSQKREIFEGSRRLRLQLQS